eukprot:RCo037892
MGGGELLLHILQAVLHVDLAHPRHEALHLLRHHPLLRLLLLELLGLDLPGHPGAAETLDDPLALQVQVLGLQPVLLILKLPVLRPEDTQVARVLLEEALALLVPAGFTLPQLLLLLLAAARQLLDHRLGLGGVRNQDLADLLPILRGLGLQLRSDLALKQGLLVLQQLGLQLLDHQLRRVHVHPHNVHDLPRTRGPSQRAHGFLVVHRGGRESSEHRCPGVASQRVREEGCQHGISVGNVPDFRLDQLVNHSPETGERLVDIDRLLQVRPGHAGLQHLLRASQINQVDSAALLATHFFVPHLTVDLRPCHGELHNGVRPGGLQVHQGGSGGAVLLCMGQHSFNLRPRGHGSNSQTLDDGPFLWVGHHRQGLVKGVALSSLGEQVQHLLVVDLQEGHRHRALHAVRSLGCGALVVDSVEHQLAQPGDDARIVRLTHHGMSLTRRGLPVGEDAPVVAVKGGVQRGGARNGEDVGLIGERDGGFHLSHGPEHLVKREVVHILGVFWVGARDQGVGGARQGAERKFSRSSLMCFTDLFGVEGSDTHHHANRIIASLLRHWRRSKDSESSIKTEKMI